MKTISINVESIKTSAELHQLLKEKLSFPEYYGMNWDAFWDSITGIVQMPEYIEIIGWHNLKKTLPNDSKALLNCFIDYNDQPDIKMIEIYMK